MKKLELWWKLRAIRYLTYVVIAYGLLVIGAAMAGTPKAAPIPPVAKPAIAKPTCTPDASQLLDLINQERIKLGAPMLVVDPALAESARAKLNDEVNSQYYGHNLLNGDAASTLIRAQGVNAAWGEDLDENALNPVQDWKAFKNSPAHYASLTNPAYTRVGIAEKCVNFVLKAGTGPDDNSNLVGSKIKELTVVHLAAPEPAAVAQERPVTTYCSNSEIGTLCTSR